MTQAGLEAGFDFEARIGTLDRKLDRMARQMGQLVQQPAVVKIEKSGVVDTNGDDLVIGIGKPSEGFVWYVLNLVIGGVNWSTPAAGKALVVTSSFTPNAVGSGTTGAAAQLGLASIRDEADSLPLPSFYSRGQFVVQPPEALRVIITGGTPSQTYVVMCVVEEVQTGERVQVAAV